MNFFPHHKTGKSDPRLVPTDHYPAEPIPGLPRPSPTDSDLSFEDALADLEFSRFLHAEYDVQAPAESLTRLMAAIQADQQPTLTPKQARISPAYRLAFAWRGLTSALARPTVTRLASGVIAVMIMAAALVPNISMVLQGTLGDHDAGQIKTIGRGDYTGPPLQELVPNVLTPGYDRIFLLQKDPPDTLVPPKRDQDGVAQPQQAAPLGTPRTLLRKE